MVVVYMPACSHMTGSAKETHPDVEETFSIGWAWAANCQLPLSGVGDGPVWEDEDVQDDICDICCYLSFIFHFVCIWMNVV